MRQAIEVTMEVVQIVRLHPIAFRRCHITPLKVQAFDQAQDWKIFPWWLDRYNELSFPYRRCYCCQLEDVPLSQTDFSRQVVAYGVSAIESSLEKGQLQSH